MYPYMNGYQRHDYRFGAGFGWLPFLGGLAGGFLGGALAAPRPLPPPPPPFGFPGPGFPGGPYLPPGGYPGAGFGGYPGGSLGGYPGVGAPGFPGSGYPIAPGGAGYQEDGYPFYGYTGLDSFGSGYPAGDNKAQPKY
ncbi:hypothetical protein [Mesobacillus jeotgali]|uniref:hypothetical protein n=1 Tax=Mesobacillus jeotgali TaxID=129985 RepID=UPI0009A8B7E5|nr:hypothetical protein [Mesobacillus jeotgali]